MKTDIHKEKAAAIFGVPYDEVTDEQRKYAKIVNYVFAYSDTKTLVKRIEAMRVADRTYWKDKR